MEDETRHRPCGPGTKSALPGWAVLRTRPRLGHVLASEWTTPIDLFPFPDLTTSDFRQLFGRDYCVLPTFTYCPSQHRVSLTGQLGSWSYCQSCYNDALVLKDTLLSRRRPWRFYFWILPTATATWSSALTPLPNTSSIRVLRSQTMLLSVLRLK